MFVLYIFQCPFTSSVAQFLIGSWGSLVFASRRSVFLLTWPKVSSFSPYLQCFSSPPSPHPCFPFPTNSRTYSCRRNLVKAFSTSLRFFFSSFLSFPPFTCCLLKLVLFCYPCCCYSCSWNWRVFYFFCKKRRDPLFLLLFTNRSPATRTGKWSLKVGDF